MQHIKRSRDHKNVCAVSGGTGGAAPSAEDTTQTPMLKNQRRVPTMGTINPYERTRNGARRSAGRLGAPRAFAQTDSGRWVAGGERRADGRRSGPWVLFPGPLTPGP